MTDKTELLPCPFCGGEAETVGDDCMEWIAECVECCASSMAFATEAEAIAAWNTRAAMEFDNWFYLPKPKERIVDYGEPEITRTENGYKVRHIADVVDEAARRWGEELGEYVMRRICEIWNTHATQGTLTAEQVRDAIYAHSIHADCADADWQAIADELNAALGGGECEWTLRDKWSNDTGNDHVYGYETGCGARHTWWPDSLPKFCPTCGGKVKAVKR